MLIIILGLRIGELAVFWLSGSDIRKVNKYEWTTSGLPLNYTAWYSDGTYTEPNQVVHMNEKELCLSLRSDFGYKWNDDICSRKHYYICDNQSLSSRSWTYL